MDANENTKTYSVHQDRIATLCKRLDSIARRAAKLGVGSVEYTVGPVVLVPFVRHDLREAWQRFTGTPEKLASLSPAGIRYRPYCEVILNATTPKCEGWEFAATLQHLNGEAGQVINLLRVSPHFEQELPHQFRTASATNCDHCHKNISTRRDTFVVHHATGAWKQVGRSCLCDFLGGHDPHAAARQLEYVLDAVGACEEGEGWGGGGSSNQNGWSIGMFLALVAVCIRLTGWTSRGKAKADYSGATKATADDVLYLLIPPSLYASEKEKQAYAEAVTKYAPQPCDLEVADKALQYAREVLSENQDRSDYEHNLYVATLLPAVTRRTSGIAASLIPYYLKEVEERAVKEAEARLVGKSQHFGEVSKRYDNIYVKLLNSVIQIEGNYGTTYLHKFLTREGNLAVWFANNCPGMEQGVEYRIAATIKAHNERNGTKQTALARVTVFTDEGRAQAEAKEVKRAALAAKKAEREAKKAAKQSVCIEQTATV
jgi:hypothetical protein